MLECGRLAVAVGRPSTERRLVEHPFVDRSVGGVAGRPGPSGGKTPAPRVGRPTARLFAGPLDRPGSAWRDDRLLSPAGSAGGVASVDYRRRLQRAVLPVPS